MAKENSIRLYGQILVEPAIHSDKDGHVTNGHFILKIWRRANGNNRFFDNYSYDCPVIMSRNPDKLKVMASLRAGDMILIDGVICSRPMNKISHCEYCQQQNEHVGLIVWIEPIMIMPIERNLSESDGNERLQNYTEISNKGFVIGRLCKDPEMYTDTKENRTIRITQYLLCVERHYRIKEDEAERKSDYFWVKTYGEQAETDYECLSKGSYVYINGALQTRNITMLKTCAHCGKEYQVKESVTEIVPYSVEYLENWDRPTLDNDEPSPTEDNQETTTKEEVNNNETINEEGNNDTNNEDDEDNEVVLKGSTTFSDILSSS